MIFDKTGSLKTGSLANTKRHDYLPFGEELFANQGLRTGTMGYGINDGIRQKFTQKERDNETGSISWRPDTMRVRKGIYFRACF